MVAQNSRQGSADTSELLDNAYGHGQKSPTGDEQKHNA
jgi:hypothetical protein